MKKSEKIFEVENLTAKIKDAKAVALADYKGINVNQMSQLRNKVKEAGGELQVVKNTLFSRALKENSYPLEKDQFTGATVALFSDNDEFSSLKALASFAKSSGLLPFKIGFMAGKILSKEELVRFAGLPGMKELQAKLVGMLVSQPTRLVYALNWNLQRLVLVLSKIKKDN